MEKACCRIGWRPVLGLVAGIILVLTVARSPQGEGFGQLSSDVGAAQEVANGIQQVPPAAPSFAVLYSFTGGADGGDPQAGLIWDAAGNLYGTTAGGGKFDHGVVFKLSPTGTETVLHSFTGADGGYPAARLIRGAAGNLYGTTEAGGATSTCNAPYGCGVVFKLSHTGTETVLYTFTGGADGDQPFAGLIRDAAGNLYGTTEYGGATGTCPIGCGVVFKLSPIGTETVLHSFTGGADGANPAAGLIRDAAGNFYGTTFQGGLTTCPSEEGNYGCGVVFKLSPTGSETVLYTFTGGADGSQPVAGLIRGAAGNLYGTTQFGGATSTCNPPLGCGVVFKLSPTGTETVLYSFTGGADGGQPVAGLIRDAAGNLYGTTFAGGTTGCNAPYGCGVVFKLSPSGTETVLHSFTGGADGANPTARLVRDSALNLYGTTQFGGVDGNGVVFRLTP